MDLNEITRYVGAITIGVSCGLGIVCLCYVGGWLLYKASELWCKRKRSKQDFLQENELLRKELGEIKARLQALEETK